MAATVIPLIALLVIIGVLAVAALPILRPSEKKGLKEPSMAGEDQIRERALALRDALDRRPFGDALAHRLWQALMRCPVGEGVIYDFHRDFCGQGLIRTEEGVKLCDIEDGGYLAGPPIASWSGEATFVAFLAAQSDYSCSGWDENSPVFATDEEWYRNNQRLTREVLERFLKKSG